LGRAWFFRDRRELELPIEATCGNNRRQAAEKIHAMEHDASPLSAGKFGVMAVKSSGLVNMAAGPDLAVKASSQDRNDFLANRAVLEEANGAVLEE
jgi:hypothetical protein